MGLLFKKVAFAQQLFSPYENLWKFMIKGVDFQEAITIDLF